MADENTSFVDTILENEDEQEREPTAEDLADIDGDKKDNGKGKEVAATTQQVTFEPGAYSVPMQYIKFHKSTQMRAGVSQDMIRSMKEHLEKHEGDYSDLPPVDLFWDQEMQSFWIGDGNQRFAAATGAASKTLKAAVRIGTLRDAQEFALGANAKHDTVGVRRSAADMRKSVLFCLNDEEWKKWTQRVIAEKCGVSHTYVQNIVKELREAAAAKGEAAAQPETLLDKKGNERKNTAGKTGGKNGATANGAATIDWNSTFTHFGHLVRLPDDIAKAYPEQAKGGNYLRVKRLTVELNKALKEWQKDIKSPAK